MSGADDVDESPVHTPPREATAVDDGVLRVQLAYYRARANEYDEWFLRQGRYDRGPVPTARWHEEVGIVRQWLEALDLEDRDVLELAAGTGLWTERLVAAGARVTAVDAAPEMLTQLRRRLGTAEVELLEADLFAWVPRRRHDAVVSCFFISHVPDERLDAFLALVASALAPGGIAFLLDGLAEPSSTAKEHVLPGGTVQTMRRQLNDGRSFEIVKRFRSDAELAARCAAAGLAPEVRRTPTYFQAVLATRS